MAKIFKTIGKDKALVNSIVLPNPHINKHFLFLSNKKYVFGEEDSHALPHRNLNILKIPSNESGNSKNFKTHSK